MTQAVQEIVGTSRAVQALRTMIATVAPTHLPVLVQGPTGAGKELVAAAIHRLGMRRGRHVAFNVCAVGDAMFEDALFGHVRGAFTGAVSDSDGFLREANGGTLFLDEVGGLPLPLQAKLLRALETGVFRPVGARTDARSDFRLVSASNEPVTMLVREGRFRADLAHRIAGVVINVPSLRDRLDDIPSLVSCFLGRVAPGVRIEAEAIELLQTHHWPGNIRELRQVVEWAAVLGGHVVTAAAIRTALGPRLEDESPTQSQEDRAHLVALLERFGGDTLRAAAELGVHRATLYRRMKRLSVETTIVRRGPCADGYVIAGSTMNLQELGT